jgi:hypothetical protein
MRGNNPHLPDFALKLFFQPPRMAEQGAIAVQPRRSLNAKPPVAGSFGNPAGGDVFNAARHAEFPAKFPHKIRIAPAFFGGADSMLNVNAVQAEGGGCIAHNRNKRRKQGSGIRPA